MRYLCLRADRFLSTAGESPPYHIMLMCLGDIFIFFQILKSVKRFRSTVDGGFFFIQSRTAGELVLRLFLEEKIVTVQNFYKPRQCGDFVQES